MKQNKMTVGQRFIEGFGKNDSELLSKVLAKNVKFYGTLAWGIEGSDNLIGFALEFHKGLPGLKIVLHDEFYNKEMTRLQKSSNQGILFHSQQ